MDGWIWLNSNIAVEEMLYDEQDLINTMDKIEPINYHQQIEANGIKFWCYNAGTVMISNFIIIIIIPPTTAHPPRVLPFKLLSSSPGHVLGAAMFMIEIAGVRILYTGDFSRQEDRHLMAAGACHTTRHATWLLLLTYL
jgi:cleavage and polyadenylation specificity factor subunit 3